MQLKIYDNRTEDIPIGVLNEINKMDIEGISDYFSDPFTFNIGIVYDDINGKVLGAGIIRVINEFKMVIENNIPDIIKSKVLKTFTDKALELKQCNEVLISLTLPDNIEEIEKYKELMKKHFNFYENDGIVLRLEK